MIVNSCKLNGIFWGIWKIDESIDQLYTILNSDKYKNDIYLQKIKHTEKLKEKLAVRALLQEMTQKDTTITYTQTGKPILTDTDLNISISHTHQYAAVALSTKQSFGIDIEHICDKVVKIKNKFINQHEYIDPQQNKIHLLLHWSAKEAMYKAINQKGIDFKNDLQIQKFNPEEEKPITAHYIQNQHKHTYQIHFETQSEYVLTLAYAKNWKQQSQLTKIYQI